MTVSTPIIEGSKFIIEKQENIISIKYFNGKDIAFIFTGLNSEKTLIFVEWLVSSAAAFHKIPFEQITKETVVSETEA